MLAPNTIPRRILGGVGSHLGKLGKNPTTILKNLHKLDLNNPPDTSEMLKNLAIELFKTKAGHMLGNGVYNGIFNESKDSLTNGGKAQVPWAQINTVDRYNIRVMDLLQKLILVLVIMLVLSLRN